MVLCGLSMYTAVSDDQAVSDQVLQNSPCQLNSSTAKPQLSISATVCVDFNWDVIFCLYSKLRYLVAFADAV